MLRHVQASTGGVGRGVRVSCETTHGRRAGLLTSRIPVGHWSARFGGTPITASCSGCAPWSSPSPSALSRYT